jgi:hypothetical protein
MSDRISAVPSAKRRWLLSRSDEAISEKWWAQMQCPPYEYLQPHHLAGRYLGQDAEIGFFCHCEERSDEAISEKWWAQMQCPLRISERKGSVFRPSKNPVQADQGYSFLKKKRTETNKRRLQLAAQLRCVCCCRHDQSSFRGGCAGK